MREELELFSHNLRVYMEKYHYTQAALGEATGNSNTTVNDWVKGRKFPRFDKLTKLCELFHCNPSDLLEKYTTEASIEQSIIEKKVDHYLTMLNEDGKEHLLRYLEDLNPKFYKDEGVSK